MRFGLFLPQGWRLDLAGLDPREHWAVVFGLARRAEAGPWESVWVYDHFHTSPHTRHEATHEAWSLMAALAASTESVRLGQMCTCAAYRNPAYLAKVAATVDIISGGRVEMGIGAGWYEQEWRAYGYGFPPARDRLGILAETVEVVGRAWRDGEATFHGEHVDVDHAICEPRPLQPGGIPLWIAGGGERRTLRIAAEHAAYTNFDGTPEGFAHKSGVLDAHCRELGRDPHSIVRSANYNVIVAPTEAEVENRLAALYARLAGLAGEEAAEAQLAAYRGMPACGTPEQVVENLRELRALGMGYAICYFPDLAFDTAGLELFEREVVPALA